MQMYIVFTVPVNATGMSHGPKACKDHHSALPAICDTGARELHLESAAVSSLALGFIELHCARTLPAPPDPLHRREWSCAALGAHWHALPWVQALEDAQGKDLLFWANRYHLFVSWSPDRSHPWDSMPDASKYVTLEIGVQRGTANQVRAEDCLISEPEMCSSITADCSRQPHRRCMRTHACMHDAERLPSSISSPCTHVRALFSVRKTGSASVLSEQLVFL